MKKIKILIVLILLSMPLTANKQNPNPEFFKTMAQDKVVWEDVDKGIINAMLDVLGGTLSVAEDVAYALLKPIQAIIKKHQSAIINNPYKNTKASVRCGYPICDMELDFRDKRFCKVKKAQEKLLGTKFKDEDVLEVAFSFSGGGWRAQYWSLGVCGAARSTGLLDCVMCMSSLSGSTWFLGPWLLSGKSLQECRERALDEAHKGIELRNFSDIGPITDDLWVKFAYNQPINILNFYGALLGNALLSGLDRDPHQLYLSDQRYAISEGDFPMPVYTATLGEREKEEFWFEFTPYEVGSRWLSAYVPSWGFGRHYKKGISIDDAPEQSFGFLMGIFGSAFAFDFEDIYDVITAKITFPDFLKNVPFAEKIFNLVKEVFGKIVYDTDLGDIRFAWARVPNFVYKMKGVLHNKYKDLKLVDAGLNFNNPVFATYRKPPYGDAPDIIFMFDTGMFLGYDNIKKVVDYAKSEGLKFPEIKHFDVGKQIMFVFKDDKNLDVPVVVYMPRINGINLVKLDTHKPWYDYYMEILDGLDLTKEVDSGFAHTRRFKYTRENAEKVIAAAEFNLLAVTEKIKDIMKERISAKRKFRKIG